MSSMGAADDILGNFMGNIIKGTCLVVMFYADFNLHATPT